MNFMRVPWLSFANALGKVCTAFLPPALLCPL